MLSSYAIGSARCGRSEPFDPAEGLRRAISAMRDAHERGEGGHRHRHGRHRGFGPGAEGFGGFGFGPGGPGGPRGRGRKARRGDIRTAALLLLSEEPRNGYQIMQEVEQRSDGVWRPSPGSVYPALQQLEDEALIRSTESDGRKLFEITDDGRARVAERPADATAPWEQMSGEVSDEAHELIGHGRQVIFAAAQVMRTGSKAQIGKARDVLDTARRELYRILADGEPKGEDS
ncbi:MAG TPA: PadR family transcriptional regulator [Solirubrobacteraceae bacterium]|jgi:DNA-binding PadR family transcriptional regulator|nr:PadR family transcriptional regulator [Solirubrobacteraceae bacterium]